jgi:ankyrin repeat protein
MCHHVLLRDIHERIVDVGNVRIPKAIQLTCNSKAHLVRECVSIGIRYLTTASSHLTMDATIRKMVTSNAGEFARLHATMGDAGALGAWRDGTTQDTALHLAAAEGDANVIDAMLVALSTNKDAASRKNKEGKTPVCIALERPDDSGVVGVFLARGAMTASGKINNEVYLVHCALKGHVLSVRALLDAGADPNSSTNDGYPLLFMLAATFAMQRQRDVELSNKLRQVVAELLRGGAAANAEGPGKFTALHVAGEMGDLELIALLLEHGADGGLNNVEGKSPADIAAEWGHSEAVTLLLGGAGHEERARMLVQKKAEQSEKLAAQAGEQRQTALIPGPEDPSEQKWVECKTAGNKAFVDQDFAGAFEHYKQGLRHKTNDSILWSNAAAAALRLGDDRLEDAITHARMARTVDVLNVKAWYREGQAAQRMKLWEDAAAAYYEAFLVNNDAPSGKRVTGIDLAALVKECVDHGRKEHLSKQK